MSMPPTHSRTRSRKFASASRPMPAKVPAAPFSTFTKSSNIRFSDCMPRPPFEKSSDEDIGAAFARHKGIRPGLENHDLVVEIGREAEPGEIGEHQGGGRLPVTGDEPGWGDRQEDHHPAKCETGRDSTK